MPHARDDGPLATSKATAGRRCVDEHPRRWRDRYRRLRDDRLLIRTSGPPWSSICWPFVPLTSPPAADEPPKVRFAIDSSLEEDGFELAVPPRRERLWAATPGKHCRFGPEPVSGSAFRAAVSDWQRPEEPFAGAGPMVRIHLPPPESLVPAVSGNMG
jgi:hypothetical protein